jgi:dTMP kinase
MSGLRPGRFITLEGGEGVGKSTQLRALATALRGRGLTVVETREPGGSAGAEAIRELLLHREADAWGAEAEALLFAAARSDHVRRVIAPAIARGDWVLCDRFIDSTRAYQGGAQGLPDSDILALHRIGSGGLLPDRTLLMRADPAIVASRLAARGEGSDRFEGKGEAFHAAVAAAFEAMAAAEPDRFRTIDAGADAATVTTTMLSALSDLLP